jgi:hypothetical protein
LKEKYSEVVKRIVSKVKGLLDTCRIKDFIENLKENGKEVVFDILNWDRKNDLDDDKILLWI